MTGAAGTPEDRGGAAIAPKMHARTWRRLLGRLLWSMPTLVGVTLVTFALVAALPGDAALVRAGEGRGVTAEVVAANRALAGLDRPLLPRYGAWLLRSARLDFGRSLVDGRPVRARMFEALPATAALALLAFALALGAGVPAGAWLGARRRSWALEALLLAAYALPSLGVALALLRAGAPWGEVSLAGLLGPALCLGLPASVAFATQQRAALEAALASDYVRTARAKGAGPLRVVVSHALRNALLPTIALAATELPLLLSGSVLVERVFGLRGLGALAYEAVLGRDYPLLVGVTTLAAAVAVAAGLLADAAALVADPRLRRAIEEAR